jgi:osmoprotectant transport system ATP-binding protein
MKSLRGKYRPVLVLDDVAKRYEGAAVLHPTSLSVARGERVALIGPSGSGKSTLLRMVLGLIEPDAGRVLFDGVEVRSTTAQAVRRRCGYVIQDGGLFPHLTAGGNVALVARRLGWTTARVDERIGALLALVRLERALLGRYPDQLSGGQRQRVGIMRALMLDPEALLLDEPMAALDPMVRAELQDDLLAIMTRLAKTVILVTHDLAEAALLCPRIVLLHLGRIVQAGAAWELAHRPAAPFVKAFVSAQRAFVPAQPPSPEAPAA